LPAHFLKLHINTAPGCFKFLSCLTIIRELYNVHFSGNKWRKVTLSGIKRN